MIKHFSRENILKTVGFIIGGVILAAFGAFLFGLIVLYLWNWLMPEIFGLPEITYIQAWGIVLLSHILFKSPGGGKGSHGRRKKHGEFNGEMRRRFEGHGRKCGCNDCNEEPQTKDIE